MRCEPPRVERDADGTLIIRKDRLSPADSLPVALVGMGLGYPVVLLLVLLWSMFIAPDAKDRLIGGQAVLVVGAIVLLVAAAPTAFRAARRRAVLGEWRIADDGFEFVGVNGNRRSLTPDQVVRVGWYPSSIRLIGRDARIAFRPEGIPPAAWQPVRNRIEAILSPRFDLTVAAPADTRMVLRRIFLASMAPCLLILAGFWALVHDPIRWGRPVLGSWVLMLIVPLIPGTILAERDNRRQIWRSPRPTPGEENSPMAEVMA